SGSLVWPASGMLTGSGVALILRYVPTSSGEYWSWSGWYWFAAVAGASVLTKYLIRWRGDHIFNPSNLGLVVAFLLIGEATVEPLDFWWAPLGPAMIVAYVLIIGGGSLITRRLHLLEMAAVFWVTLVAGLGVLAASGHCMIATWSTTPVCDGRFWTALATSPEILIFLFFMITDPKTIPRGPTARIVFAGSLAVMATLLIAPQTVEYGAKVALLGSLVLWSPLRWVFDRTLGGAEETTGIHGLRSRLLGSSGGAVIFARGLAMGALVVLVAFAIVVAGGPARPSAVASLPTSPDSIPVEVDPVSLPIVTVDVSVDGMDTVIDEAAAADLAVMLAENLALEGEAMRTVDVDLLAMADGGERLTEIQARLNDAVTSGERPVDTYTFNELTLRVAGEEEGQTSAALAFDGTGTVETIVYDSEGAEIDSSQRQFDSTFVMRQLAGERWLIVEVLS
ncbi:MAG TPA: hypothetical protein VFP42_07420, partial [Acidimicrobiia bacterium]|nr:hypothetical protein [Acidimicrobiia bacterium]